MQGVFPFYVWNQQLQYPCFIPVYNFNPKVMFLEGISNFGLLTDQ